MAHNFIGQIRKLKNERQGSNTSKVLEIVVPTGQGSLSPENRLFLENAFENAGTLNVTLTESNQPLWKEPINDDPNQENMKLPAEDK